jgi:hypothetical protein
LEIELKPVLTLVAAVVALAVAACGDDEARVSATGTTPTSTTPTHDVDVPDGVAAQYSVLEEEIAAEGGAVESGDWRIAYIKEPAEGWFRTENGRVVWRDPAHGETAHLEIIPIERDSGRIIPDAGVTLEVLDKDGQRVEKRPLSFYYAEFFHYADNFRIPRDGEYTLRATVEPPPFRRHGDENGGPALMESAQVEFENVTIELDG